MTSPTRPPRLRKGVYAIQAKAERQVEVTAVEVAFRDRIQKAVCDLTGVTEAQLYSHRGPDNVVMARRLYAIALYDWTPMTIKEIGVRLRMSQPAASNLCHKFRRLGAIGEILLECLRQFAAPSTKPSEALPKPRRVRWTTERVEQHFAIRVNREPDPVTGRSPWLPTVRNSAGDVIARAESFTKLVDQLRLAGVTEAE